MSSNPYESPSANNKLQCRGIDWFDVFAYGICAWIIIGIVCVGGMWLYFILGYSFGV